MTAVKAPRKTGRRICAWCTRDMGAAETEYDTHGICPACLKRELGKVGAKK
jgi:hypothetical protein